MQLGKLALKLKLNLTNKMPSEAAYIHHPARNAILTLQVGKLIANLYSRDNCYQVVECPYE